MIAPDLLPIVIIVIVLLPFSALITCFFVYNRWSLRAMTAKKRWAILLTTFSLTVISLLMLVFFLGQSFQIWLVTYTITMTIIAFGDLVAARLSRRRQEISKTQA